MLNADEFLNEIERRELAPSKVIERLRRKNSAASGGLPTQSVAKFLVKQGYLSTKLAGELLIGEEKSASLSGAIEQKLSKDGPLELSEEKDDKRREEKRNVKTLEIKSEIEETFDGEVEREKQSAEAGKYGSSRHKHLKKAAGNEFDSPLILIGGSALVLLVLGGLGLAFLLNQESGDELLRAAKTSYESESFSQSIAEYERFVEDFPTHAAWSTAKVQLAIARLRQTVEVSGDYEASLAVAEREIPAVEDEPEFRSVAHGELASLLPRVARGLADAAEKASQEGTAIQVEDLVAKTNAAMTLVGNTKYLPKRLRDEGELAVIREMLDRIERRAEAQQDLDKAIGEMTTAIAAGDPREAYGVHSALVGSRPEFESDARLLEVLAQASSAERAKIRFIEDQRDAATGEAESVVLTTVASATQRLAGESGETGVYATAHGGIVYGIDTGSGDLLWRRAVGFGPVVTDPVSLGDAVLLVDHRRQELVRLRAESGQLVWRAELDGPTCQPVVVGGRVYVPLETGRLLVVDSDSGQRLGHAEFAQALRSPPGAGPDGERLYLAGEHSSLYTLDARSLECLAVTYTGHSSGGVVAPPTVIGGSLALVENTGLDTCQLRVFRLDEEGVATEEVASEKLQGACQMPPVVLDRRLFLATDKGEAGLFELAIDEGDAPMTAIASRPSGRQKTGPRYVLGGKEGLWIAGVGLGRFVASVVDNRLSPEQLPDPMTGDRIVGPLVQRGRVMLHTRRRSDSPGVTVGATELRSGKLIWETDLATAPLGEPAVSATPRGVIAPNVAGDARLLSREEVQQRVSNRPETLAGVPTIYDSVTRLADGSLVFSRRGAAEYTIASPVDQGRTRSLRMPDKLACDPTPFGEGMLSPLVIGQVLYLDAAGNEIASPLQPAIGPGKRFDWLPAASGEFEGESLVVVAERRGELICGAYSDSPTPNLSIRSTHACATELTGERIAIAGGRLIVVLPNQSVGVAPLPQLSEPEMIEIGGDVTWGPYAVGEYAVVATGDGRLLAIDTAAARLAWEVEMDTPVGAPLVEQDQLTLVTKSGSVVRLSASEGERLGSGTLGETPASGPTLYNDRLLVSAADSTLLVIRRP